MKQLAFDLILILCILSLSSYSLAESSLDITNTFDPTVYETAENYKYDKFDKTWSVYAVCGREYTNACIAFGLKVYGDSNRICQPPFIYMWIRDSTNTKPFYTITGLKILVGEVVYSASSLIESETQSTLYLDSKKGKELLTSMAEVDEISIKYLYSTGSYEDDIIGDDYKQIKALAKMIVTNNSWDYVIDDEGNNKDYYDNLLKNNYPLKTEG